jgi:hypothetical protein
VTQRGPVPWAEMRDHNIADGECLTKWNIWYLFLHIFTFPGNYAKLLCATFPLPYEFLMKHPNEVSQIFISLIAGFEKRFSKFRALNYDLRLVSEPHLFEPETMPHTRIYQIEVLELSKDSFSSYCISDLCESSCILAWYSLVSHSSGTCSTCINLLLKHTHTHIYIYIFKCAFSHLAHQKSPQNITDIHTHTRSILTRWEKF